MVMVVTLALTVMCCEELIAWFGDETTAGVGTKREVVGRASCGDIGQAAWGLPVLLVCGVLVVTKVGTAIRGKEGREGADAAVWRRACWMFADVVGGLLSVLFMWGFCGSLGWELHFALEA